MSETCSQKKDVTVAVVKEVALESKDSWVTENVSGLTMQVKRQWESAVEPEHHEVFNRLLGRKRPQTSSYNFILSKMKKFPITILYQ